MHTLTHSSRVVLLVVGASLLTDAWGTNGVDAFGAENDVAARKKAAAELRQLIKRLSAPRVAEIDEVGKRLEALSEQGLPVRRALCQAIVDSSDAKGAENLLKTLDALSPAAARQTRLLAGLAEGQRPDEVFRQCSSAFKDLSRDSELAPETSVVVLRTLMRLARSADGPWKGLPFETRTEAYKAGVALLARQARDDDAFGDVVTLVGLDAGTSSDQWTLRSEALEHIGKLVGNSSERAKIAVPLLTRVLQKSVVARSARDPRNSMPGRSTNSIVLGAASEALGSALHDMTAMKVIDTLGEIGPNAAPAAAVISQLQTDRALGNPARRALQKLGK